MGLTNEKGGSRSLRLSIRLRESVSSSCFGGPHFVPNPVGVSLRQEERTHNKCETRNCHRVPEPSVDITGCGADREAYQGHQSSKDSVAYVIWQGERRVSDFGGERLHQIGSNWTVHHGDVNHLDEHQQSQQRHIWTLGHRRGNLFTRCVGGQGS